MFSKPISCQKQTLAAALRRAISISSSSIPPPSNLARYGFKPPPSLPPQDHADGLPMRRKEKPRYRPPSSLDREGQEPLHSDLPFDFRFSYTESNPDVKPIGLREPRYSPFGPGRVDRVWTGTCAPTVDPAVRSVDSDCVGEGEGRKTGHRRKSREEVLGEPLTPAERKVLIEKCQKHRTKRQVNLGRDGLTHNMLNDIHNNWKHAESVRIKCLGVPTVDMNNVCTQLEDKTGGQIIHRQGGTIVLYRGRYYHPKKRPVIPLMLWKPHEPIYPKLIKTTIDGLTVEETKEMRKKGLMVPALTKLAKNGYYANLVTMVRDSFLTDELVRIDCKGLERSDYKKIGAKLKDLVPCVLVTFDKEQIVVWRGKNYHGTAKPKLGNIVSYAGAESDNDAEKNHQNSSFQIFDDVSDSDADQSTQINIPEHDLIDASDTHANEMFMKGGSEQRLGDELICNCDYVHSVVQSQSSDHQMQSSGDERSSD